MKTETWDFTSWLGSEPLKFKTWLGLASLIFETCSLLLETKSGPVTQRCHTHPNDLRTDLDLHSRDSRLLGFAQKWLDTQVTLESDLQPREVNLTLDLQSRDLTSNSDLQPLTQHRLAWAKKHCIQQRCSQVYVCICVYVPGYFHTGWWCAVLPLFLDEANTHWTSEDAASSLDTPHPPLPHV